MNQQQWLNVAQIVTAIVGIIAIILQNRSEQGSSFFGGGGEVFKLRKGLDRAAFFTTILVIIILIALIYIDIRYVS